MLLLYCALPLLDKNGCCLFWTLVLYLINVCKAPQQLLRYMNLNDKYYVSYNTHICAMLYFFATLDTHRLGGHAPLLVEGNPRNAGAVAQGNLGHYQGRLRGLWGSFGRSAQQERGKRNFET